jgi:protein O-mannosyl-transferase
MVLLYEIFFFRGAWKRRLLCLLPILATLPIVPSVFISGDSPGDLLSDVSEGSRLQTGMPRMDYLFTQFRVIVTYLRLLVLPVNQNLDYDYPIYRSFFTPEVFLSFLLLAALFSLALYLWFYPRLTPHASRLPASNTQPPAPEFRLVSFGILWFFLALAVESSLVPIVDVIFEHRLYLPSVGAAAAFASVFFLAGQRMANNANWCWTLVAAALVVLALGVGTIQRNQVWGDETRLWRDVVAKAPGKARPYNNLGVVLNDSGQYREAMEILSRAIAIDPVYYQAYNNLGYAYIMTGQSSAALPLLKKAIRMAPEFVDPYTNLAGALNQLRQFRESAAFIEQNLPLIGHRVEAHYHLGVAHAFLGNRQAARRQLEIVADYGDADLMEELQRLLK